MKRALGTVALLACLGASPPASASGKFGTDLFLSGIFGQDFSLRTHVYALFGSDVGIGPIVFVEPQHSYLLDVIIGAGVQFGGEIQFEVFAGSFQRQMQGTSTGFATGVVVSHEFGRNIRIAVPVVAKYIAPGGALASRMTIDILPYVGVVIPW